MYSSYKTAYSVQQKILLLIICTSPALIALAFIVKYGCNVPCWDQWAFIGLLEKMYNHQSITLSDLMAQHNEHRILFPRLIMLGLAQLSHWNIKYEMYVGFLLLAAFAYVIFIQLTKLYAASEATPKNFSILVASCLVAMPIIFSLAQQENLLWGWQIQIFLNVLAIALGAHFLTNSAVVDYKHLGMAAICGIVATYSFANGLFYWPIGVLVLVARRRYTVAFPYLLAGWLAVSGLIIYSYLHGYEKPQNHPSIMAALRQPSQCIAYILTYLGTPMVHAKALLYVSRASAGLVASILILVIGYFLLKTNDFWRSNIIFWHVLLLYAIISAIVTAFGRSGFGIIQATSSRYVTISSLFWLWIFLLGIYVAIKNRILTVRILTILACLFFAVMVYYDKVFFVESRDDYFHKMLAEKALYNNDNSSIEVQAVMPKLYKSKALTDFLRKEKLTLYHNKELVF